MKKHFIILAAGLIGMTVITTSCKKKKDETTTPTPTPNLYTRVGGSTMVSDPANSGTTIQKGRLTLRSVTDSSIYVIAADTQMAKYFPTLLGEVGAGNTTGFSALSKNFTDFLCVATGSTDYSYTGKSMTDAHNHATNSRMGDGTHVNSMKVNSTDFDKFVGDIGTGLAKNGVTSSNNASLVNDLVALLNTTKSSIVQR
ncbi:MAG TPA: hypothetical protein VNW06_04790 [Cytophagaceae bacterium]|jgi:hypothetical protein|nr:hypothetical protein [Cytophagaceae bacterium]